MVGVCGDGMCGMHMVYTSNEVYSLRVILARLVYICDASLSECCKSAEVRLNRSFSVW